MYTVNALLFPYDVIPTLKYLRDEKWEKLVEQVSGLEENHEEVLAFILMMIRLNVCLACETDSYRAMRGCSTCAQQTLRRYKGSDDELLKLYQQALKDVRKFTDLHPDIDILHRQTS